jgi:hypothetical protein
MIPKNDLQQILNFGKNQLLGILSFCICGAFVWCAYAFKNDVAPDDLKKQYFVMFFISCLTAISFLVSSISHFLGKNFFKSMPILAFIPVIYFLISLTLFLSFDIGLPNAYNLTAQSLLTLFFVYYTQIFVNCVEKINIPKRLVVFGFPAIFATLSFTIPTIFSSTSLTSVSIATSVAHTFLIVYIFSFLVQNNGLSKIFNKSKSLNLKI